MKPPTLIAGPSVRAYVIRLLQDDVARRDALARAAEASLPRPGDLGIPDLRRAPRLGVVTRLRNDALRARDVLDFFRDKFSCRE